MKKLHISLAVGALALGLVIAPGAIGKPGQGKGPKGAKQVPGTVSVFVTPDPVPASTTTVTATGNVGASSGCRKDRDLSFTYVNSITGASTPLAQTAVTGSNGDYSVVLPRSTATLPSTAVLQAKVAEEERRVGSKKKGKKKKKSRQFNCLEIVGQSAPITLQAPPAP